MPNYSTLVVELDKELKSLATQRDEFNRLMDKKMASVAKAIEAIKELAEEIDEPIIPPPPLPDEAGFTQTVRGLLDANAAKVFTAVEIRDYMLHKRPKSDPRIMLIHVHNTVKRLKKQDEVDEVVLSDGRIAYRSKGVTLKTSAILRGLPGVGELLGTLAELSEFKQQNEMAKILKANEERENRKK